MLTEKAELILHPIRLQIIQTVAGRSLTPGQIAELLPDIPQASLYRHLKKLSDGGILQVVGEKQIRGTVEKSYALLNPAAAHLSQADLANATPQEHFQIFTTFVLGLLKDFATYLQQEKIDMFADGVGYQQVALYLSDTEFMQMAMELNRAMLPFLQNTPAPGRRRRTFSTILMPAQEDTKNE